MKVLLEFLSTVLWTTVLAAFVVAFQLVLFGGYVIETIAAFCRWFYALYRYVRDYSHENS